MMNSLFKESFDVKMTDDPAVEQRTKEEDAASLPGVAIVVVTAQDGTTKTYTIYFTVASSTATNDFTVNSTFNMDSLKVGQILDVQTVVKNNKSLESSVLVIVALYGANHLIFF